MTRGDLSDPEWELVQPFLPLGEHGPIPDPRRQFDGVMWRFRTGSPWRDVPERFGSWSTLYDRFRTWATTGVFQFLMEAMIAEAAARDQVDLGLVMGWSAWSIDTSCLDTTAWKESENRSAIWRTMFSFPAAAS